MKTKQTNMRAPRRDAQPLGQVSNLQGWRATVASIIILILACFWAAPAKAAATNDVSIASIGNLTILEDAAATNVAFRIALFGGAAGIMTATSSAPTLIPDPSVAYGTPTAATNLGTLTFTPVANQNGSATITLVVTNDKPSTNSINFTVTVTPVNDAPTFTLATNAIYISRTNGAYSSTNFATNIWAGATNESSQTMTFAVTSKFATGFFSTAPTVSPTGTLAFEVTTNKYGTNVVTVICTDSGDTANKGKNTSTNTFTLGVAYLNYPPNVVNLSLTNHFLENAGKTNFSFVAWDVDQSALTATVSCSGAVSNIVTPSVALVSAKTNFSLSLTTKTNAYGTGVVSVVVSDGTLKVTNDVTVEVEFVNQRPYSSKFAKLTILEDATTNLAFTVADPDDSVSNITAVATSSNTNLIRATNLVVTGAGTNRTLAITTTPNSNGVATITVVCNDTNSNYSTNTFDLVVTAVNDAPTFTISTNLIVLAENSGLQTKANFVTNVVTGPADEAAQTMRYTAKASSSASFKSLAVAADGTLTFQLATNVNGFFPVTLTGQDSGGTANKGQNTSVARTFYIVATNVPATLSVDVPAAISIAENKSTNVTVKITDIDRNNINIDVTSSTNSVLATMTGVGKTRVLTITPVYPAVGSATITLISDDGLYQVTNTIAVTVTAVNYAPVLSAIDNLSILENAGATNLAFTISDKNNDQTNTAVNAVVLDTNLVSASIISTNATNRYVVVTPLTNAYGSSVIRLVAGDGVNMVSNSFVLTVLPVNNRPSFALNTNTYASLATNYLFVPETSDSKSKGVTITNFLSNVSAGPTNESKQKLTFFISTSDDGSFATKPAILVNSNLTFKSSLYATGNVTLTIYATDDGGTNNGGVNISTTNTVTLVMTNINNGPVLGKLAALKTFEDTTSEFPISVTDVDTVFSNLTVTATSDKTNLVSVVATNNGSEIILIITPTDNTNSVTKVSGTLVGNAVIKVVVSDGALSATNSFTVTVLPANDAPTFDLSGSTLTSVSFLAVHSVSNMVTNVVVGPTTDETNQTWAATAKIATSDAKYFVKAPVIDKKGTLTYTPSTNAGTVTVTVTVKDSGGKLNGGEDTSSPDTFDIVIPSNPFTGYPGEYNGLFYNSSSGAKFGQSGFMSVTVDTAGKYAGYLLNAGASNRFTGQFAIDGTSSITVGSSNVIVTLTNKLDSTENITGVITNSSAGWQADIGLLRSVVNTESIVPGIGQYLLVLQGSGGSGATNPAGDGVIRMNVESTGLTTFGGWLADGTVVTQRVSPSAFAEFPMYFSAYGKGSNGVALSWLVLTDTNPVSAIHPANAAIFKTSAAGGALYSGGYTNASVVAASTYYTWDGLWLTGAKAIVGGGNLSAPITNVVDVAYDTVTVVTNNCNLSLTIDPATGLVSGSFIDPSSLRTNQIKAAVLQMQQEARGFFLGTNVGGYFLLK